MKKRVVVSVEAIKASGRRLTKASAKLEGREVPEGHVRSAAVEQYIADRASTPARAQANLSRSRDLLAVLASEVWPLLSDGSPITKAEQEHALGDPTNDA